MSSFFSPKKILLFGFIFILLLVIPLTVLLLQKQQEVRSRANPATTLSFSPNTPQNTTVGQKVSFDIFLDPGTNQVSFAKLVISYDDKKLTLDKLAANSDNNKLSSVLEEPTPTPSSVNNPTATVAITLSVGADPTAVIQTRTKIATLDFTAKDVTDSSGAKVQFVIASQGQPAQTQVLSIGSSDQSNENVLKTDLSSLAPATVIIAAATTNSTATPVPTATPTPPSSSSGATSAATNQPPVCSNLNLDRSSTGTAPYSIAFTTIGNDSDGTISKVTFNFGDGPTQDVTTGGGIGAASIQTQITHTYQNAGTYTTTAILTDNNGATSDPNTCKQTITVNTSQTEGTTITTQTQSQVITAPPPSLPPTGPSENILIGGIVGGILSLIGAVLLFSL